MDIVELKKIMVEQSLEKITSLSYATGINRNTLGQILRGKVQPSSEIMRKLVETLNIPPEKAGSIFFNK